MRRLGVIVGVLAVSDGSGWRPVGLDDPGLFAGFHEIERGAGKAWRWTDGEGHLSPNLWSGLSGAVFLRLTGVFAGLRPNEGVDGEADRLAA